MKTMIGPDRAIRVAEKVKKEELEGEQQPKPPIMKKPAAQPKEKAKVEKQDDAQARPNQPKATRAPSPVAQRIEGPEFGEDDLDYQIMAMNNASF